MGIGSACGPCRGMKSGGPHSGFYGTRAFTRQERVNPDPVFRHSKRRPFSLTPLSAFASCTGVTWSVRHSGSVEFLSE